MKTEKIMLFLLLLFCGINLMAQEDVLKSEYSYRRYTMLDGLPNHLLELTFQDKQGYLWIGTYNGFAKFDGKVFKPFMSEKAINILHFDNDEKNKVRVYTYHNVYIIDKNDSVKNIQFTSENIYLNTYNCRNLPHNYLILENENATEKYLVYFQNDTTKEILRCEELNSIGNSKPYMDLINNKIYLPSRDCLNVYDLKTKQNIKIDLKRSENFLFHSRLGLLTFTNDGIYKITGSDYDKLISFNFSDDKMALEMADGSIIIKDKRSLYRFSNNTVEEIAKENMPIVDILKDNDNNLWMASHNGLFNYFKFDFKNYYIENDVFKTVVEDENNYLWFGTIYGNLYKSRNNKIKKEQYPGNEMVSFMFGSSMIDGKLFFPRDNDVLKYENGKFSWLKLPHESYDYDGYLKVSPFNNDKLLILRATGVYLCDRNGKIIKFYPLEFFKQLDLQDLIVIDQTKWAVAGHIGISVVENDSVILIEKGQNIHNCASLCVDNQKRIWLTSENKLTLIRGDSIVTVNSFAGESLRGIYPIDDNYLIIATIKSIYFFNMNDFFNLGQINMIQYNQNNGFTGMNVQINSFFRDHAGIMYVQCNDKMVAFEPQKVIRRITAPNLVVQSFAVSKDNVQWENVDNFINAIFPHKNKNFKISFIGLNYSAVENVRYHYRLLGFQNNWSEPSKQREVTFNNLPPGNYTFEIYADAGTDESRSETQSFAFSIKPAFWQTAWFLISGIAFLMLASAGVALYIQRRKNKVLLEKLRAEKELNELRISSIRLKAIPHFNANVLAAIEYYIANRTKEEAMRILGIYSDFTFKTLSDVDKAARPLSEELAYVKMYLDLEKIRFLDKFDFHINVEDEVDKNVQLPNMILHTYCENAVKHGLMPLKSGGILSINVSQRDRIVCVSVEDNGVGRDNAGKNPYIHSTKQGLSILNRQIEIYNRFNREKINSQVDDLFESGKPSGTRFMVEVPLDFEYVN